MRAYRLLAVVPPLWLACLAGCAGYPTGPLPMSALSAPSGVLERATSTPDTTRVTGNAGALTGVVTAPGAAIIDHHAARVFSGNSAGLMSDKGGNLTADAPVSGLVGATLHVFDLEGTSLTGQAVTTDAEGRYRIDHLAPSGPWVLVQASATLAGRQVVVQAIVPAPRQPGAMDAPLSPATSMVAWQVLPALRAGDTRAVLSPESLRKASGALEPMLPADVQVAAILPSAASVGHVNTWLSRRPELVSDLRPPADRPLTSPTSVWQPVPTTDTAASTAASPSTGPSASPGLIGQGVGGVTGAVNGALGGR